MVPMIAHKLCSELALMFSERDWHKLSEHERVIIKDLEAAGYLKKKDVANGFVGEAILNPPRTGLNVYDKVWIMHVNEPKEMFIFAITESMDYYKQGSETHYQLVSDKVGAGWGNNEGIRREAKDIFNSKEELLASL